MAACWQRPRVAGWLGCLRTEPADASHDWPGFAGWRRVSGAGVVARRCARPRVVAALRHLCQSGCAGLCVLFADRSLVSVRTFWIVLQHLRLGVRARSADAESVAAGGLSLGTAVSRRLFWRAVQAGKVYLPLRSAAAADDSRQCAGVEAFPPRRQSVRDHRLAAAVRVHLLLREIYDLERRLRLG